MTSNGLFANVSCEPRQARKGATVVVKYCAGVRLLVVITFSIGQNDSLVVFWRDADAHCSHHLLRQSLWRQFRIYRQMTYQVLARRWRPRFFSEMAGQEHVLQALSNALDRNRLHHAYLFSGTRGVGKTTIARLLAKCLNCEEGISSEPCGECSSCKEINEGRFLDLIEIDAASNRGIDDVREIIDRVQYTPSKGRFKIYIIDEVHQLTKDGFNALLKTLEEPPAHIKFLFATTEPKKLPITVLSRCLQFGLKNLSSERIVEHLEFVLTEESIQFQTQALWALARAADGSMRDALSLADQAIGHGDGQLIADQVNAMLGTIASRHVVNICQALCIGNGRELMSEVDSLAEHSPDYLSALREILSFWHKVAMCQTVPEVLDESLENFEEISSIAKQASREDVQLFYQICLLGQNDLKMSPDGRAAFEMVILRALAFQPVVGNAERSKEILSREKTTERAYSAHDSHSSDAKPDNVSNVTLPNMQFASETGGLKKPAMDNDAGPEQNLDPDNAMQDDALESFSHETWVNVFDNLGLEGSLAEVASHCSFSERRSNELNFVLRESDASLYNASHQTQLAQALSGYFNRKVKVFIKIGAASRESPRSFKMRKEKENYSEALEDLNAQQDIIQFKKVFNGKVDIKSVLSEEIAE